MTSVKNSRHVAYEQVKAMIDFMGQHIEFATGSLRTLETRHISKKLWGELTSILNDYRGGTKKSQDGWSKYWSDFKNKLKNKARLLKRQKHGTSMTKTSCPLTKLEKRALIILGPYFEKKSRPNTSDNPLSDVIPEVKLEAYQENNDFFSKQIEDHHDRLSSGEGVSDESVESSDEDCEDNGNLNLNDPLIQNLYPKWLIEVEKKRSEADLLRAKAEEKRASAAAKSAEASLLQAEAMGKLADAAVTQSAAISRIAAVLENGHIDDVTSVSSQGQSKSENTPSPGPTL